MREFNKLILPIPFNIDDSEIQNGTAGEGIKISFITNVGISYPLCVTLLYRDLRKNIFKYLLYQTSIFRNT